ncbi:bacitracin ABC transporter permease [Bacillus pseudomycoides]|uniref:ABC transporter permease n=1 Tax=Bacillus pseudomycoides TaxID=64104 RepID=A0A2H3MK59_9BACI|nr:MULTISPECIES: ABC transporter permease [Bacillus]MBD5795350.1 bacitracin ABC transporter permease [Bacillus pseudomycoides]MBJ8027512.1 ABC transporter permease [Bacillus cereus group sp. N21]MCR8857726.1 ABC transporter permease [Bacillus pseudomycoides]MCX2826859.1 ABC transporter permease [Bacillus sp. DHT2]MDR4186597.1 ABC transporter permease [Bacillus pseudomycoides]
MLKLMKLEWKKHRLSRYFKGVAICIVAIFVAVGLMAWGSRAESEQMFLDYAGFMSLTNIFIRTTFMIFSAVILSRLVIDEYKSKTMQLLFTYPLQRKKLMQAKLAIVFGFCFCSIIIATFIINMLIFFLNPIIGFFETPVSVGEIIATVPATFISAFMMAGVSLIPLYFGMRKKSTPTTITSSILIGLLINSTVSNGGGQLSLFDFIIVPIVLCLLGLAIGYLSYHKVDKIDVA